MTRPMTLLHHTHHEEGEDDATTSNHVPSPASTAVQPPTTPLNELHSRIDVIFNDKSGNGSVKPDLDLIDDTLHPLFSELRIWKTCDYSSPYDTALKAIQSGATVLIACGGDGTVASVAAAIKNAQSTRFRDANEHEKRQQQSQTDNDENCEEKQLLLGIVPRGTANAFCAALHIPFDIRQALKLIVKGPTRRLDFPNFQSCSSRPDDSSSSNISATTEDNNLKSGDPLPVATLNNSSTEHDADSGGQNGHPLDRNGHSQHSSRGLKSMLLLCGIGLEAETIRRASGRLKKTIGCAAYAYAGLESIWVQRKFRSTITLYDCVEIDKPFPKSNIEISEMTLKNVRAKGITVANAAPAASVLAQGIGTVKPDDGYLEVTFISNDHPLGLIGIMINLLWSAFIKRNLSLHLTKNIYALRAKKVVIQCTPPQYVVVDGEPVDQVGSNPIEITLNENRVEDSINVIAPNAQTVRKQKNSFSAHMKRLYRNIRGLTLFTLAIMIAKNSLRSSSKTRLIKQYDDSDEEDD